MSKSSLISLYAAQDMELRTKKDVETAIKYLETRFKNKEEISNEEIKQALNYYKENKSQIEAENNDNKKNQIDELKQLKETVVENIKKTPKLNQLTDDELEIIKYTESVIRKTGYNFSIYGYDLQSLAKKIINSHFHNYSKEEIFSQIHDKEISDFALFYSDEWDKLRNGVYRYISHSSYYNDIKDYPILLNNIIIESSIILINIGHFSVEKYDDEIIDKVIEQRYYRNKQSQNNEFDIKQIIKELAPNNAQSTSTVLGLMALGALTDMAIPIIGYAAYQYYINTNKGNNRYK